MFFLIIMLKVSVTLLTIQKNRRHHTCLFQFQNSFKSHKRINKTSMHFIRTIAKHTIGIHSEIDCSDNNCNVTCFQFHPYIANNIMIITWVDCSFRQHQGNSIQMISNPIKQSGFLFLFLHRFNAFSFISIF